MTPGEAAAAFRNLADSLRVKVYSNSIRKGTRKAASWGMKKVRSTTFGGALYRNRNNPKKGISGTPPLIVRAKRVTVSGDTYQTGIATSGVAALIETGGRLRAHEITPKRAKRLAFQIEGRWTFPKVVHHPGAVVKRESFLDDAGRVAETEIQRALEEGIEKAVSEAGLV